LISALQSQVEQDLSRDEPEVEVLLAELVGGATLRVFIDHPAGVTLALCERVSAALSPWRERYALEVSSPGASRPLTKPAHFRRFVGRRARVRMCDEEGPRHGAPVRSARPRRRGGGAQGRARSLTGELLGATEDDVTLAADGGVVTIPYEQIRRCNLVEA
jgi:ribosome maturation factor RimP